MLDVHPPHGKLHGIGDFLLHLFTITCGLFIALLLEAAVERHHKNELRDTAETNLRQELQDNRKATAGWIKMMGEEQKSLIGVLGFLQARKSGQPYDIKNIQLGFSITQLSDASWRTAAATGALGLMNYAEAQSFASAYQLQDETMLLERETLEDFLQLQAYTVAGFDPAKITAADAVAADPLVRRALAHLVATQQIAQGLQQEYDQVLK